MGLLKIRQQAHSGVAMLSLSSPNQDLITVLALLGVESYTRASGIA